MNTINILLAGTLPFVFVAASTRMRKETMACVIASLMICVTTLAPKIIETPWLDINATASVYAAVLVGVLFYSDRFGKEEAKKLIFTVFISLLSFVLISSVIARIPCKFSEINSAVLTIFSRAPRVSVASFLAFLLASRISIEVFTALRRTQTNKVFCVVTACSIGQFIDSIIFFPGAFIGVLSIKEIIGVTFFGGFNKVILTVLFSPLAYVYSDCRGRHAFEKCIRN